MKQLQNDYTEAVEWDVVCHYDEGNEPADFIECMALFMLEREQGWDSCFRPIMESKYNIERDDSM